MFKHFMKWLAIYVVVNIFLSTAIRELTPSTWDSDGPYWYLRTILGLVVGFFQSLIWVNLMRSSWDRKKQETVKTDV